MVTFGGVVSVTSTATIEAGKVTTSKTAFRPVPVLPAVISIVF